MANSFSYKKLLQYFLQGILVVAPITVTLYALYAVITSIDSWIPIFTTVDEKGVVHVQNYGVGIVVLITVIILVGYFSSFFITGRIISFMDKFMQKTPAQLMRTDITAYRDHLLQRGDARKTVTKKLSFVSAMLQTAYDAGYLPANVARGLKVPRAKVETIKRMSFPKDSLIRIFGTRVYTERARPLAGGGEAIAWVPMLALATGARLEELCQLRVADVLEHDLGWMLNIEDGEGQRVKTSSSRRLVPLHSDVIAAGFSRFVQDQRRSGHEWLFSDLEPDHDGRRGGNFGKFFARFLRQNQWCGITDRRLVFHSFRHTFKTLCC